MLPGIGLVEAALAKELEHRPPRLEELQAVASWVGYPQFVAVWRRWRAKNARCELSITQAVEELRHITRREAGVTAPRVVWGEGFWRPERASSLVCWYTAEEAAQAIHLERRRRGMM